MTKQVTVAALVQTAPGKAQRFKELTAQAIQWINDNEPETLQFDLSEGQNANGAVFTLFERYASQAALELHESSDNYRQFFASVNNEGLLVGEPQIVRGTLAVSFRR